MQTSTENGRSRIAMKNPPIVSPQEWTAAREQMLVKEKALTRARDALAAERRRMPWQAVDKAYAFDGPAGSGGRLSEGSGSPEASRTELEAHARLAGVRETDVLASRYLHRMAVVGGIATAAGGGLPGRPTVRGSGVPKVFLAGDWVDLSARQELEHSEEHQHSRNDPLRRDAESASIGTIAV